MIKHLLFLFFIVILSLPAIWDIITPGYFPIHDDTQVVRTQQMYKALTSGQFPVRWVADLGYGYGYPIFNFYNPLPYYFGAGFMFFGFDALLATKLMMIVGVILAGISMFLFARTFFKGSDLSGRSDPFSWPAFLTSILYLYAPYHGVQIYVRGAVAEYWAYSILPLVFYAIWKNKIVLGGIFLAALITSHNLTALMSIPFLAITILFRYLVILKSKKSKPILSFITHYSSSIILALGLSAFFWLPALVETNKTQVSAMVFEQFDPPSKHLVTLNQLWTSSWGYGGSSSGIDDGLSLQLGKIHLLGSLAAIVILLWTKQFLAKGQSAPGGNNLIIFSVISLLFSIFMILPASRPMWDSFPIFSYIQFPWRFLTFASLFASILTAWSIWTVIKNASLDKLLHKGSWNYFPVIVFCFLLIVFSIKFFHPQFKYPTSATQLTSRERILWEVSGRSDEYLPIGFIRPTNLEQALRIDNPVNQVLVDELKKPTPVRRIGNAISFVTVIGMIGYYERLRRQRR